MRLEKQYEKFYSCKRKKDFITVGAVVMFLLIVVFEIYLMFVLPVQLTRENAMRKEVERQNLSAQTDTLRKKIWFLGAKNSMNKGEAELVLGALDILAIYIRENQEKLTMDQILELKGFFDRIDKIIAGWQKGNFKIRRESFDPAPVLLELEKKLGIESSPNRK